MNLTIKSSKDTLKISFWKWVFSLGKTPLFESARYGIKTSHLSEYFQHIGKTETLLQILSKKPLPPQGMSTIELISRAAKSMFPGQIYVCLYNVDLIYLGMISDRIPGYAPSLFTEDFVWIPVSSRAHAKRVLSRIPTQLAYAVALDDGVVFDKNEKEEEKADE